MMKSPPNLCTSVFLTFYSYQISSTNNGLIIYILTQIYTQYNIAIAISDVIQLCLMLNTLESFINSKSGLSVFVAIKYIINYLYGLSDCPIYSTMSDCNIVNVTILCIQSMIRAWLMYTMSKVLCSFALPNEVCKTF